MIILSFLLEGILSCYLPFSCLFTLTALILETSYQKEETVLKYSLIIGVLYDIAYTNTLILNALLFFFLCLFIFQYIKGYRITYFYCLILNTVVTISYLIITYLTLLLFHSIDFNIILFLKTLLEVLILNTIYFNILYIIHHKRNFKT